MYRRPITAIALSFILGIVFQYYFRLSIKILYGILFIHVVLFIILEGFKRKEKTMVILLSIVILGALHLEYNYETENTLESFINKKIEITGDCEQKYITDKSLYILHIRNIKYKEKNYKLDSKTLLKVFDYDGISLNNKRITVSAKLKVPEKARNPKMFDYNLYLKTQGINTIINTNGYNIKILKYGELSRLIVLRQKIKSFIYKESLKILPGDEGEIALSIVFGDKRIIDENLYNTFRQSGTAHALAVSGLHFGILLIFIDFVLKILKLKEKNKAFIITSLIWLFAFIVGFTPSVIRACSMITLSAVSSLIDRRYDLFTAVALISLINVIINPFTIYNVSFQLSFLAVLSIAIFYSPIYEKIGILPEFLRKIVAVTLSAQIGTSPIIAYHFNSFSPFALVINIPVVLLITVILPLSLVFFIALFINTNIAQFIAIFDEMLIKLLIKINSLSSYLPYNSNLKVISPDILFFIIIYLGLIFVFHKDKIPYVNKFNKKKVLLTFLIVVLIINAFKLSYPDKLKITFIDVGQGDCVLIETPRGKNILIDGGEYKKDFLSGFLLKNHISYIDLIFISHIHNDHIGGIIDVMDNIDFGALVIGTKIYSSEKFKELAKKISVDKTPIMEFTRGESIKLEKNLTITSIHPSLEPITNTNDDINNNSLACILKYKDLEILLTGDIEKEAEKEIIQQCQKRDVDIIKVCHHGSNTSNTLEFIEYFNPEIAVIQVGKNSFGHPHNDIIDRLRQRDIKIYRNDINGAVIIEYDENNIKIDTMLK